MLIDSDYIRNFIISHAQDCFPEECCGLIFENGKIVRTKNSAKDKTKRFIISNEELQKTKHFGKLVGFYHSHHGEGLSVQDYAVLIKLKLVSIVCNLDDYSLMEFEPKNDVAPIFGRPFIVGLMDCVDLVRDIYKKELNIDIKNLNHELRTINWSDLHKNLDKYSEYNTEQNTILKDFFVDCGFVEISKNELQEYDLILFRFPFVKTPSHVMVFRHGKIVHHPFDQDSKIEEYNKYYQKYSVNYLRYKDFL